MKQIPINFHAQYLPTGQFRVSVNTPERRWVEDMSEEKFIAFANSSEPLKVSGTTINLQGDSKEVEQQIRAYFKQVADTFLAAKGAIVQRGVPGVGAGKVAMTVTAKQIKPNGEILPVIPKNGNKFTYEELLELVGCEFIEVVTPPGVTGAAMVLDEDGKSKGLPLNPVATRLWQEGCEPGSMRSDDPVVGTVLICHRSQLEE